MKPVGRVIDEFDEFDFDDSPIKGGKTSPKTLVPSNNRVEDDFDEFMNLGNNNKKPPIVPKQVSAQNPSRRNDQLISQSPSTQKNPPMNPSVPHMKNASESGFRIPST